jgi:hypothetical protein
MKYKNGSKRAANAKSFKSFLLTFSNNLNNNKRLPKKMLDIISLKKIVVVGFKYWKTCVDHINDKPQKTMAMTPLI